MNFRLALVTGASSGIGEALCRLLASKGIDLIITGRNTANLHALAQELNRVKVTVHPYDLSQKSDRNKLIEQIHTHVPDLIINNAGFGLYGEALSHSTATQSEMVQVNVEAVLELTLEGARAMRKTGQKGVIVNISSAASFLTFPLFSVYTATKAFVNSFSTSFDEEMKPYGIRVLTSCPGVTATKFRIRASSGASDNSHAMTSAFAAEEIWKQIQGGKQLHIFNWWYRLSIFLARYLIPHKLLMKILRKQIEKIQKEQ